METIYEIEEIWPIEAEIAFLEAIQIYPINGLGAIFRNGKRYGKNFEILERSDIKFFN